MHRVLRYSINDLCYMHDYVEIRPPPARRAMSDDVCGVTVREFIDEECTRLALSRCALFCLSFFRDSRQSSEVLTA